MHMTVKTLLTAVVVGFAAQAAAQVTFYEREGFRGRAFTTDKQVWNFERYGFNDRASSAVINRGRWEVCEDARFSGRCVILRPGRYPSLAALGLNDDDESFCKRLVLEHKVAAIPVSAFYAEDPIRSVVRFCFAKRDATLDAALERLAGALKRAA